MAAFRHSGLDSEKVYPGIVRGDEVKICAEAPVLGHSQRFGLALVRKDCFLGAALPRVDHLLTNEVRDE